MKNKLKALAKKSSLIINHMLFNNQIRIKGNKLNIKNSLLWKCKIKCTGHNNQIIISNGCICRNLRIVIRGSNNTVIIGENNTFNKGELWIEDDDNSIIIGNRNNFCGEMHLACIEGSSIRIEDDCLFSSQIIFRTGDSHSILNREGNRINPSKPIHIKKHVWIGNQVTILKGVTIENNSVIGTGSIVTKSINESNVVITGVPAEIVKRDINWCRERVQIGFIQDNK